MNKSDLKYQEKQLMLDFIDPEHGCCGGEMLDPHEYDESIMDCMGMLQYSIALGDKEEIAFWRRMLQETKVAKRFAKINKEKSEGSTVKGYCPAS